MYNMVILNGNSGEDVISSATITLNGTEIVRANEFNQKVDRIDKAVTLAPDNTLTVSLASGPDGFLTVSIECVSGCLGVQITSPFNMEVINRPKAIVKGALYNVSGETGVTITNGQIDNGAVSLAQVHGLSFAGTPPLDPGANTIMATATDACGYKTHDTITVNTVSTDEPVRLSAVPGSGVPSATTGKLEVTFEAEVFLDNPVASYSWDFNGDGVPEQQGSDLSSVSYNYLNVGLYFPVVTVTDTLGNIYSGTTIVNVLSAEEMDITLKAKWGEMKERLGVFDIDGSLEYFIDGSKEKYGEIFNLLASELSTIAANMQEIELLYIKGNTAKYRIRRNHLVGGLQETVAYYIYFMKDENGLWKVVSF